MSDKKTAIVTGASGGIGAGLVAAFLKEGYNVVATSLDVSRSLSALPTMVLVDGDIGKQDTAAKAVEAAITHFGAIDVLVKSQDGRGVWIVYETRRARSEPVNKCSGHLSTPISHPRSLLSCFAVARNVASTTFNRMFGFAIARPTIAQPGARLE